MVLRGGGSGSLRPPLTQTVRRHLPQGENMANLSVTINVIQKVDVKFLKHHYLKYFGHEIPQTQINVFTPEFLDFCLYIIQEASKIDDKK